MRTLRVLSRLLAYPSAELIEQMPGLKDVLSQDGFLKSATIAKLVTFMDQLNQKELINIQENYVEIFDRGRAHCLHLFEHVHGESRFRGQAMLDLSERYAEKGLVIGANEFPDYLPIFLEFISICEPEEALETLATAAPVVATIGEKLKRQKSGYAHVFKAIVELSGAKLNKLDIIKAADASLPQIKTLDELDEQWREPDVFGNFDGVTPDCGTCEPMPLQRASQGAAQ